MMASAVPVTGTLRVAASTATPLQRAWLLSKQQPRSCHARQQEEEDGADVPGEDHHVDGQMSEARGPSDQLRKERQVRVRHEKLGAKGVQKGVGNALDGGHVDGAVVHAEVIAVDQYGQGGDGAETGKWKSGERDGGRAERRLRR